MMNTPPRHSPRFLPTLTEVVRPSELAVEQRPAPLNVEALTQTLLVRVDALLQARVQHEMEKLIRAVAVERADIWVAGIRAQLHQEVKSMVFDAIGTENDLNKPSS